jgi:hypothetical protein
MKPFKKSGEIFMTSNYDLFKRRSDNRVLDEKIVRERMESIKMIGQQDAIKCDPDFYTEDGQHRIEACRRLQIPVKFVIMDKKLTTEELAALQSQNSKWKVDDYAHSYTSKDNEDYKLYNLFRKNFPEFNHSIALMLLTNTKVRNRVIEEGFKVGQFKAKSYNKAKTYAEMIKKIGVYYDGYFRNPFVAAFLTLTEHPDFEFERLYRKIPKRRKALMEFSKTEDYITTLQDIYNWKETKKIYFL